MTKGSLLGLNLPFQLQVVVLESDLDPIFSRLTWFVLNVPGSAYWSCYRLGTWSRLPRLRLASLVHLLLILIFHTPNIRGQAPKPDVIHLFILTFRSSTQSQSAEGGTIPLTCDDYIYCLEDNGTRVASYVHPRETGSQGLLI